MICNQGTPNRPGSLKAKKTKTNKQSDLMKNNRKIYSNAMVEEHPLSSNEQKTHSLYSTMSDSYMLGLPVRVLGSIVEAPVMALVCTVRAPV